MRYWSEPTSRFLLPCVVLLLGFAGMTQAPAMSLHWLETQTWVPYTVVLLGMFLSIKLHYGRLLVVGAIWLVLLAHANHPAILAFTGIDLWTQLPWFACVIAALMWRDDQRLRALNRVIQGLLLTTVAALTYGYLEIVVPAMIKADLVPSLPKLSPYLSNPELALYAVLFVSVVRRLSNHLQLDRALLGVAVWMMLIAHLSHNVQLVQLGASLFAVGSTIGILWRHRLLSFQAEVTGIPTRADLTQYTRSLGNNYTLVRADIDQFTSFNGIYGSQSINEILRMIAHQLQCLIDDGRAFHIGGEEFALVFPNQQPQQVMTVVDQLRDKIANYPMAIQLSNWTGNKSTSVATNHGSTKSQHNIVKVTMSFGLAYTHKHSDFDVALQHANRTLSKAKQAGCNTVQH